MKIFEAEIILLARLVVAALWWCEFVTRRTSYLALKVRRKSRTICGMVLIVHAAEIKNQQIISYLRRKPFTYIIHTFYVRGFQGSEVKLCLTRFKNHDFHRQKGCDSMCVMMKLLYTPLLIHARTHVFYYKYNLINRMKKNLCSCSILQFAIILIRKGCTKGA